MYKKIFILFIAALCCGSIMAQDVDLFKMLNEESKKDDQKRINYTSATFKTTRLLNGHSVENVGKGILDVKISHRFSTIDRGWYEFFGLDNASMRMGVDYGVTNKLMIGVGRSTYQKQYDGFLKYKLLRQSSGYRNMPVTVSLLASAMISTDTNAVRSRIQVPSSIKLHTSDKFGYCYQVLIGRKFNESTSVQIMPSLIHYNVVKTGSDVNDVIAFGIGGRQKISKRVSINAEYYYVVPGTRLQPADNSIQYHNSLSFGVDIETGGHVFQFHLTNSMGMTERTFIAETDGRWSKGQIHFGFNIARVFTVGKKNKNNKMKLKESVEKS